MTRNKPEPLSVEKHEIYREESDGGYSSVEIDAILEDSMRLKEENEDLKMMIIGLKQTILEYKQRFNC